MDMILTKILAAFLALSLVTTRPDSIKTAFDPTTDTAEVTAIMRDGCAHMRKAFDVESLDLDEVIRFYNEAEADLPDHTRVKGARFTGTSGVLDAKGERFADLADSGR